jgi:hypothetical protein
VQIVSDALKVGNHVCRDLLILKTFPIMQEANTSVADFSHQKGVDHGFQALRRLRQLGFKGGTTVFFAVDFDALDEQVLRPAAKMRPSSPGAYRLLSTEMYRPTVRYPF